MYFDFLKPVSEEISAFKAQLANQTIGSKIELHTQNHFPSLENVQLAIITINEYRGSNEINDNSDCSIFRKDFYSLYLGNWNLNIVDLGTIESGNELQDTYFLLQSVVTELVKQHIIPIIIGGSNDLTYPVYRAFDDLDQMVNLVAIDKHFPFSNNLESSDSLINKIIVNEPHNLLSFSNIGYQTYFNSQEELDLIEKLNFEAYRLGEITSNPELAEPILRDADIVSLNYSTIQSAASGDLINFQPNGFNGKEICILSRYSGISDRVTVFTVFDYKESHNQASGLLLSQIVWYFIEGFSLRKNEYPFIKKENYLQYIIPLEDEDIIFIKSTISERWWIEMKNNYNINNKLIKTTLLPCSHNDYLNACKLEVPERWWKALKRLNF